MKAWPYKDADEKLDYTLDWSDRLDGDTISASEWSISPETSPALVEEADPAASFTNTSTTLWLTGGDNKQTYKITNTVTTEGGRIMQQTVTLEIRSK